MVKVCCLNCSYLYVTPEKSFCTIDQENIPEELKTIKKCPAFELWFGAVE